ncbi:APC family permease [Brevibacillus laterosporus]|uniref:APC family permease n=1 Tax=Brevibacillus laterosporus TaxID=1465 RepID=UPI000839D57F|nr:amino acid permease [Brevibacillus laterosporus]
MMTTQSLTAQTLQKTLTLPQIVALYIGAVLGSGILLIPGIAAEMAGPASLLSWITMSLVMIPMAITMGLLSAIYPSAGGVSHFVRLVYGHRFGNLVGWFFLLSVPIGAPILAVTGATYVTTLLGWEHSRVYLMAGLIIAVVVGMSFLGMQVTGRLQTVVVSFILAMLVVAIASAVPHAKIEAFTPFVPHGWLSIFQSASLLFWCFIGWEAVTHLSEEFIDPKKNAMKGVMISSALIALLYVGVAIMTIATSSYGTGIKASLSTMVQLTFGQVGGWIVAITALFICLATANAYVNAAARIAFALAKEKSAPAWMGTLHSRTQAPLGGLLFLSGGFVLTLLLLASGAISLEKLIQIPNATFMATYLGGCLAGIKLLRGNKMGHVSAWISLVVTLCLYPFLGWGGLYPICIFLLVLIFNKKQGKSA